MCQMCCYLRSPCAIQMYQACGPSASSVFSLESSNSAFPFSDQGDVFQSFVPNSMESQCTLNQLDLALSHATSAQYAFQDGTGSTNLQQQVIVCLDDCLLLFTSHTEEAPLGMLS